MYLYLVDIISGDYKNETLKYNKELDINIDGRKRIECGMYSLTALKVDGVII